MLAFAWFISLLTAGAHVQAPLRQARRLPAGSAAWPASAPTLLLLCAILWLWLQSTSGHLGIGPLGAQALSWRAATGIWAQPVEIRLALVTAAALAVADGLVFLSWRKLDALAWRLTAGIGGLALVVFSVVLDRAALRPMNRLAEASTEVVADTVVELGVQTPPVLGGDVASLARSLALVLIALVGARGLVEILLPESEETGSSPLARWLPGAAATSLLVYWWLLPELLRDALVSGLDVLTGAAALFLLAIAPWLRPRLAALTGVLAVLLFSLFATRISTLVQFL